MKTAHQQPTKAEKISPILAQPVILFMMNMFRYIIIPATLAHIIGTD